MFKVSFRTLLIAFSISLLWLVSSPLQAAFVLELGGQQLRREMANQPVDVFIRSTDPDDDLSNITGFNLNVFLGGGFGDTDAPTFSGDTVFRDGPGGRDYIWDAFPGDSQATPDGTPGNFQTENVLFSSNASQIRPDGLLATLFIDTTGVNLDEFFITFRGDSSIGLDPSGFIDNTGAQVDESIMFPVSPATIQITAVPEPLTSIWLGAASLAWLKRRRSSV